MNKDQDTAQTVAAVFYAYPWLVILLLLLIVVVGYLAIVNRRLKRGRELQVQSESRQAVPGEVTAGADSDEGMTAKKGSVAVMAAGVAHDLNNILSGLVSYPELLLMQLPEDSNLRKPISVIHQSGLRAVAAVSDLLVVTRDISKNCSINNINSLILESLQSQEWVQLHAEFPQLRVETKLTQEADEVFCSPTHVGKCLLNLIHFSAESLGGSGLVSIGSEICELGQSEAVANGLRAQRYLLVTVADKGAAIAEEDLTHIFEPFYSKKQMGRGGSGISMAAVWNSMLDHGGAVTVASGAEGTCFSLYYPLSDSLLP
jgi:signal transduction histidine kinase